MKIRCLTVLLALFVLMLFPTAAYAADIIVTIDGERITFDGQQPVIVDGRTLVPVRGVFEQLGFDVGWDGETRQATLASDSHTVVVTIGNAAFTTNGTSHTLDVPAQIIGGSTMLPLRAVLESVGYYLGWDDSTSTVIISAKPIVAQIDNIDHQALEDFLSQFTTLFSFGVRFDEDEDYSNMPYLVYWDHIRGAFFDYSNNEISEAPFIRNEVTFADSFVLYDFDGNGVPDILIRWRFGGTSMARVTHHRFIDGEYREMSVRHSNEYDFFFDDTGQPIARYTDWYGSGALVGYYSLRFTSNNIVSELIADFHEEFQISEAWEEHHILNHPYPPIQNPTMFGTDRPLTRVPRLTALEEELTASIIQRLLGM